jgi:glycosyltransferase involved in cell wall biosynthesis
MNCLNVFGVKPAVLRILAVVLSIFGSDGPAVNERQFLRELCKGNRCLVITLIPLASLKDLRRLVGGFRAERGNYDVVIPLPVTPTPNVWIVSSFFLGPVLWILDRLVRFDVMYMRPSLVASVALLSSNISRKSCIKIQEIYEDEPRGKVFTSLFFTSSFLTQVTDRFVISRAFCLSFPSPLLLKWVLVKRRVVPRGRMLILPAGVDGNKIDLIKRLRINIAKRGYVVGFVGSLSWGQGVDRLVRAVAVVSRRVNQPVTLLIVGDGPVRARVEELCRALGVRCVLTGSVRHEVALALLSVLDVLVVPRVRTSSTESVIPIKLLEAWALGVPVVITKHEIFDVLGLVDREHVVLCEPDVADIAEKIFMVLTNEVLRKELIKNGSVLVKTFYYDFLVQNMLKSWWK